MMIFYLRLRMHTECASAFRIWLLKAGKQIGIVPTSTTSDSDDQDCANSDGQIYGFVCQAEAELQPEQLGALFAECGRIEAKVLGIVYQETESEDDCSDGCDQDAGWRRLLCAVERLPDPDPPTQKASRRKPSCSCATRWMYRR